MARTLWFGLVIVAILSGCAAPSDTGATADSVTHDAVRGEGPDVGTDGAVAEEDFDTGAAENLAVGDETAGGQETPSK